MRSTTDTFWDLENQHPIIDAITGVYGDDTGVRWSYEWLVMKCQEASQQASKPTLVTFIGAHSLGCAQEA
jgi:hypothetical protein